MLTSILEKKLSQLHSVAVACSGGPDSMALTLLAHEWARNNKSRIVALTVDHGLRKESAAEAKQVGAWLKKHNIQHVTLKWSGKKPRSNVQELARNARYKLLTDYCGQKRITTLLVAHTLEDQAETFLLRLKRGSGVDGLSAMKETTKLNGITLMRPLLQTKKSELLAYLKTKKQNYVSDPSNENEAYDRIKIRKLLPQLAALGIPPERLAKTASNMARAREYLQKKTSAFLKKQSRIHKEGYATLKRLPKSDEIALRALATLLMVIGGHKVKPRLEELERLYRDLQAKTFKGATLGGCVFTKHKSEILVFREQKAVPKSLPVKSGKKMVWDRFEITLVGGTLRKKGARTRGGDRRSTTPLEGVSVSEGGDLRSPPYNITIGALTQEGWLMLARKHNLKSHLSDKRILYTLPALRDQKGNIIAVPLLGIGKAKCEVTFIA